MKLAFDRGNPEGYYNRAVFGMRRYLSWIEGLTTNQYVGGSNPSRRTICILESEPFSVLIFLFRKALWPNRAEAGSLASFLCGPANPTTLVPRCALRRDCLAIREGSFDDSAGSFALADSSSRCTLGFQKRPLTSFLYKEFKISIKIMMLKV